MNSVDISRAIDQLEAALKSWATVSVIKPTISHATGPNWILTLEETWPTDLPVRSQSSSLDQCVEWATAQLKDNERCGRIAWNMWKFKTKKEAEKFLTMFYLVWAT